MSALTAQRVKTARINTPSLRSAGVAGTYTIFTGSIVMMNSSGYLRPGATATGMIGVGVAMPNTNQGTNGTDKYDNSAGNDGDIDCWFSEGVFGPFENSGGGDAIANDDRGKPCYIVDDQTVALTNASDTRSTAGRVHSVDSSGVYVDFSASLARAVEEAQIISTGQAYTQTYSTANRTVAAATVVAQTAITDNGGGAGADGTIGAITTGGNVGADIPDAIKELSTKINLLVTAVNALAADDLDNRQTINALIDDLQTAGVIS